MAQCSEITGQEWTSRTASSLKKWGKGPREWVFNRRQVQQRLNSLNPAWVRGKRGLVQMKGVAVGELLYGVHAPRAAVPDFRDVWQSSDLILIVRLRNRNPALSFFFSGRCGIFGSRELLNLSLPEGIVWIRKLFLFLLVCVIHSSPFSISMLKCWSKYIVFSKRR